MKDKFHEKGDVSKISFIIFFFSLSRYENEKKNNHFIGAVI